MPFRRTRSCTPPGSAASGLLALWNALPGIEKLTKVGDRETLIDQLWSAVEALPDPDQQSAAKRPSKQYAVISMLQRPEGATVDEVASAMGWQRHTVRGVFSRTVKKLGLTVASATEERRRVYRIAAPEQAEWHDSPSKNNSDAPRHDRLEGWTDYRITQGIAQQRVIGPSVGWSVSPIGRHQPIIDDLARPRHGYSRSELSKSSAFLTGDKRQNRCAGGNG